jgi:hypothetical protein
MLRGGTEVVRAGAGNLVHPVPLADRPPGPLRSLALSRDGTRAALVIDRGVYVAKVVWDGGSPRLVSPTLVFKKDGVPRQVAWSTATELVVLQPDQGATAVQRVPVDGSTDASVVLIGSLSPRSVASAGTVLVVASADGALYSVSQGITKQARGSAPVFPG